MDNPIGIRQDSLIGIARQVMMERGLLPDFSPAVQKEVAAITRAATDSAPGIRDLRHLLGLDR